MCYCLRCNEESLATVVSWQKIGEIEDGYDYEVMIAINLLQWSTENAVFTYLRNELDSS